jgi:hypothetical protein
MNRVISNQVRELVDKEGFGADVIGLEQGTRICESIP